VTASVPGDLDRADPAGAVASAAGRCSNTDRRGTHDVLGTLNLPDGAKPVEGTAAYATPHEQALSSPQRQLRIFTAEEDGPSTSAPTTLRTPAPTSPTG
jgi:hypothetical protein